MSGSNIDLGDDVALPTQVAPTDGAATRLLTRWVTIELNSYLDMRLTQRDLHRVEQALARLAAMQASGDGQAAGAEARLAEAISKLAASSATLARAVDEFEGFCSEMVTAVRAEER